MSNRHPNPIIVRLAAAAGGIPQLARLAGRDPSVMWQLHGGMRRVPPAWAEGLAEAAQLLGDPATHSELCPGYVFTRGPLGLYWRPAPTN